MEIDIYSAIEAQNEDGYDKIAAYLQPAEDLDWFQLVKDNIYIWPTAKGDVTISMETGNTIQIKVRDDKDFYGYCCTFDFDTYALVTCTMSALRSYIKDIKETFVNIPVTDE
ncbi:hypothetical protein NXX53_06560 [Bacteroides salyersiae]|uniref:hypothetical protein n=1 Tax=Bacteroides sp. TaxID=29523 RepID=UPI0025B8EC85|nr:hypothetical protein [Bacteroides sp.]MCS2956938.1 hypothetical protein [Bacteroides salyersiae]